MNKYKTLEVLGEGAYGVVLKCKHKRSGEIFAIKKFKDSDANQNVKMANVRELKILRTLQHENIVKIKDAFHRKGKLCIVFEFVHKSLLQIIEEFPSGLPTEKIRWYSYQMCRAVQYCHEKDIIHRDIKPENLLINQDGILKLCDFGFARNLMKPGVKKLTEYVATRWYRAPELLLGASYGKPVDIWSIGCIVGEMGTGEALFQGSSEIDQLFLIQRDLGQLPPSMVKLFFKKNQILNGWNFPMVESKSILESRFKGILSFVLINFMKQTLSINPIHRLTADACVSHAAFKTERLLTQTTTQQSAKNSDVAVKTKFKKRKKPDGGVTLVQEGDADGVGSVQKTNLTDKSCNHENAVNGAEDFLQVIGDGTKKLSVSSSTTFVVGKSYDAMLDDIYVDRKESGDNSNNNPHIDAVSDKNGNSEMRTACTIDMLPSLPWQPGLIRSRPISRPIPNNGDDYFNTCCTKENYDGNNSNTDIVNGRKINAGNQEVCMADMIPSIPRQSGFVDGRLKSKPVKNLSPSLGNNRNNKEFYNRIVNEMHEQIHNLRKRHVLMNEETAENHSSTTRSPVVGSLDTDTSLSRKNMARSRRATQLVNHVFERLACEQNELDIAQRQRLNPNLAETSTSSLRTSRETTTELPQLEGNVNRALDNKMAGKNRSKRTAKVKSVAVNHQSLTPLPNIMGSTLSISICKSSSCICVDRENVSIKGLTKTMPHHLPMLQKCITDKQVQTSFDRLKAVGRRFTWMSPRKEEPNNHFSSSFDKKSEEILSSYQALDSENIIKRPSKIPLLYQNKSSSNELRSLNHKPSVKSTYRSETEEVSSSVNFDTAAGKDSNHLAHMSLRMSDQAMSRKNKTNWKTNVTFEDDENLMHDEKLGNDDEEDEDAHLDDFTVN